MWESHKGKWDWNGTKEISVRDAELSGAMSLWGRGKGHEAAVFGAIAPPPSVPRSLRRETEARRQECEGQIQTRSNSVARTRDTPMAA